jgi:electron transport complex protein RnfB
MAAGEADIDRCPPGGDRGIIELARLLGVSAKPLDPARGPPPPAAVAVIDERSCIGCALCLPACPVDAILGAPKHLHTVIAAYCTGCELCVPVCPVDCIALAPVTEHDTEDGATRRAGAAAWRERHRLHLARREREAATTTADTPAGDEPGVDARQVAVLAAMERARLKAAAAQADAEERRP